MDGSSYGRALRGAMWALIITALACGGAAGAAIMYVLQRLRG